mmetsp:Transcript_14112/g.40249  ORF Transcript_14112/g.40249 Transcript_14112/m.40249 type:complete len:110 (-) Transcript_14112:1146-1475(-)|eukprot:CAMPEP_0119554252 /NCGR_PEP_ID=MMETSP1352-20130426/6800_1 /TAXON_ID=265584 /ORGANISM="Stauroneis constricta, Strain CCMP1120" /LENGTH=109 /DNA_ID=CAMNT_0007600817 /DNA_START=230 /DNA_END=559 /DNA_ORIENTATION=-
MRTSNNDPKASNGGSTISPLTVASSARPWHGPPITRAASSTERGLELPSLQRHPSGSYFGSLKNGSKQLHLIDIIDDVLEMIGDADELFQQEDVTNIPCQQRRGRDQSQ